jgi:uncharacterized protein (UPF0218 family)
MGAVYAVTPELMEKFRQPFGVLLRGTFSETMQQLRAIIGKEKPSTVVSVGDTVSKNLHEQGITPQVSITDNKSLRRRIKPATFPAKKVLRTKNPQGTITEEAISAVQEALRADEETHVIVDGDGLFEKLNKKVNV